VPCLGRLTVCSVVPVQHEFFILKLLMCIFIVHILYITQTNNVVQWLGDGSLFLVTCVETLATAVFFNFSRLREEKLFFACAHGSGEPRTKGETTILR
jgi:hypothetical protein